jgi:hypothetical protein
MSVGLIVVDLSQHKRLFFPALITMVWVVW